MDGTKQSPVDAYIAEQPAEVRSVLQRVRRIIRRALPEAEETISYQIPSYRIDGRQVVYFAAWKRHWSLYPVTDPVRAELSSELAPYAVSKGTVRFAWTDPVPVELVKRIVDALAKVAAARSASKPPTKKPPTKKPPTKKPPTKKPPPSRRTALLRRGGTSA